MIRRFRMDDLDTVLKIGRESFIKANSFIDKTVLDMHQTMFRELIPSSDILVYEENGEIIGAVSVVNNSYMLWLGVDVNHQSRGVGKKLLDICKQKYKSLSTDVFVKNNTTVNFLKKNGFEIIDEKVQLELNEKEYEMKFRQ